MSDIIHQLQDRLSIPLPLAFALTASAMATLGIFVAVLNRNLALRISSVLEIVSGLILVSVTVLHLIGHALEDGYVLGGALIVAGVMVGYLISQIGTHEHGVGVATKGASLASIIAIGIHSLLDGGVYAASLGHDHGHMHGGAAAGLGLIIHEGAEGVIAFFLSLRVLRSPGAAFLTALLVAAATTPLGAIAALWGGQLFGPSFLHLAFPLAAGFVGFAGVSLLWPHLQRVLTSVFSVRQGRRQ